MEKTRDFFKKSRNTKGTLDAKMGTIKDRNGMDLTDVGNQLSGSSPFSKSSLNIWMFTVHVLLKPGLENLGITLLACEMSAVVWQSEHSLALPFFGIEMKTDLFQSCGHC